MINWKYVAPRLLLLFAVALFLWRGVDPLLKWWLVASGQTITGAKVDIDRVRASVLSTELSVDGVQIANPGEPGKNLFEADQVAINLDTAALLRRQIVVEEGRLSGLRIGGDRLSSGALPTGDGPAMPIDFAPARAHMAQFGQRWLEYASDMLVQQLAAELETVQLTEELMRRWPAEYARLEARADALRRRLEDLRRAVADAGRNPLRNIETIRRAADEVAAIEMELRDLRDESERLRQQALADRDALRSARERDVAKVRRTLQLEEIDANMLSEYLLGAEQSRRLAELIAWIQWGRGCLPSGDSQLDPLRSRGESILFAGVDQPPDFLIRSLVLDGAGTFAGHQLQFKGTASGLTTQPAVYGKPAVFRLQTNGAAQFLVEAVFDRTGRLPHDRITIHCPAIPQPERLLGNRDQLALTIAPGNLHLTGFFELKGDYIAGKVIVRQQQLKMTPHLADKLGGDRLAASLETALNEIESLEATVELSGSLQKPVWKLRSNLGPQFAGALSSAFQQEIDRNLQLVAADVENRAAAELDRFEQVLLAKQQEALGKLQIGDAELAQLSRLIAAQVGVPDRFRRGNLPLEDLFRRR